MSSFWQAVAEERVAGKPLGTGGIFPAALGADLVDALGVGGNAESPGAGGGVQSGADRAGGPLILEGKAEVAIEFVQVEEPALKPSGAVDVSRPALLGAEIFLS